LGPWPLTAPLFHDGFGIVFGVVLDKDECGLFIQAGDALDIVKNGGKMRGAIPHASRNDDFA
jgi:hypothetical protein